VKSSEEIRSRVLNVMKMHTGKREKERERVTKDWRKLHKELVTILLGS
jgi:hypothetical protein